MNHTYLIGNLTRDPDVRSTNAGIKVCNFTIAVNRRMKSNGEQQADFFNIVAWRQLAELCEKYLSKGKKVAVIGSIQTRTYEKDGVKRTAWDILADEVEFLSPTDKGMRKEMEYRAEERQAIMTEGEVPVNSGFTQVEDSEFPF